MLSDKEDLKRRFLASVEQECQWEEVWCLLIENSWYQATLQAQAQKVLRQQRLPVTWQEDVKQDAMLLLARSLRRRANLGVDLRQVEECFGGWMATIIARDCQEAVRLMRRQFVRERAVPDMDPLGRVKLPLDAKIDISLAIQQIEDPTRTVLALWSDGLSVSDISLRLEMPYHHTYYLWGRGARKLRALLGASYVVQQVG